jgi:hypothetical protein
MSGDNQSERLCAPTDITMHRSERLQRAHTYHFLHYS